MLRFTVRVWTGPVMVAEVARRLRASAMAWQVVTIEGTESVWVTLDAMFRDAAEIEVQQWLRRILFTPNRVIFEKQEELP